MSALYVSAMTSSPTPMVAYYTCVGDLTELFTEQSPTIDGALVASAFKVAITAEMGDIAIPRGWKQAMSSKLADYWREAISKELNGLVALNTWTMVLASTMPPGSNLMNCHYVFDVKRRKDGTIEKFKARLVADGNTQKHGVDFDRIFATVVKTSTIRLLLTIAAARDYDLSSIDIRQAYLQAVLKQALYMRPPPGVASRDAQGRPLVCRLNRSLYGLKQAGREWAVVFSQFLVEWGFTRSTIDVCLYTYTDTHGHILWIAVYVDDGLLVHSSTPLRDRFVRDLSRRFPTEDKGELSWILSVAIERDREQRSITMSQALYVSDLLVRYASLVDASTTRRFDSPMEDGLILDAADSPSIGSPEYDALSETRTTYMALVGAILWLANMTFPQLAYAAGQLARFLSNPGKPHMAAAIRVLIYLRDCGDWVLILCANDARGLDTYVDSSWATRFSCSGGLFFYHGCLIHWFSKMQKSVSLSSAEAEFFGGSLAARELIFLYELLADLGVDVIFPLIIWSDSKSAIAMSYDPVSFKKTKHILRSAEFLRDLVARQVIRLEHVAGTIMIADLLTKAVARALFVTLLALLRDFSRTGEVVPSTGGGESVASPGGAVTGPPSGARARAPGAEGSK
jgi:hypothetical protein